MKSTLVMESLQGVGPTLTAVYHPGDAHLDRCYGIEPVGGAPRQCERHAGTGSDRNEEGTATTTSLTSDESDDGEADAPQHQPATTSTSPPIHAWPLPTF